MDASSYRARVSLYVDKAFSVILRHRPVSRATQRATSAADQESTIASPVLETGFTTPPRVSRPVLNTTTARTSSANSVQQHARTVVGAMQTTTAPAATWADSSTRASVYFPVPRSSSETPPIILVSPATQRATSAPMLIRTGASLVSPDFTSTRELAF